MSSRHARAGRLLLVVAALGVAGCGGSSGADRAAGSPPATSTASAATGSTDRLMVVIGDSIPFGGHFCPGCTAFADTYAKAIEQATGHPVKVANRSRDDSARLQDIDDQLRDDADLKAELARADVVLVSVGFNNTPPWPAGNPCGGHESDDAASQVATVLRYRPACIPRAVQAYRAQYDRIYGAIAALAPKSSTLVAVDVYNNWIGNPGIPSDTSAATLRQLALTTRRIYDDWNAMLCASARQHRMTCVDIYHAFNGPTGLRAPDTLVQAQDYTHPSQAGNDVIAALLAKVALPAA